MRGKIIQSIAWIAILVMFYACLAVKMPGPPKDGNWTLSEKSVSTALKDMMGEFSPHGFAVAATDTCPATTPRPGFTKYAGRLWISAFASGAPGTSAGDSVSASIDTLLVNSDNENLKIKFWVQVTDDYQSFGGLANSHFVQWAVKITADDDPHLARTYIRYNSIKPGADFKPSNAFLIWNPDRVVPCARDSFQLVVHYFNPWRVEKDGDVYLDYSVARNLAEVELSLTPQFVSGKEFRIEVYEWATDVVPCGAAYRASFIETHVACFGDYQKNTEWAWAYQPQQIYANWPPQWEPFGQNDDLPFGWELPQAKEEWFQHFGIYYDLLDPSQDNPYSNPVFRELTTSTPNGGILVRRP